MQPADPVLDEAARAVLDGTPVDWTGLESSADLATRALAEQLKVLSAVGELHRGTTAPAAPRSRATSSPVPGDAVQQWGHLRILERVGSGAFGEVFRAWDTRLDREVALKLLPADSSSLDESSATLEEGRLLARVRHEHVATIYGAERIGGHVGLWMEFVRGRTLEELLRSGHQFSAGEAVAIGLDVCDAVAAVHAAGVLHRDIKAQNVMRADDGRVVLMDFGTGWDNVNGGSRPAGTPLYLAPEVLRGEPATTQSDVYSLGVLLYHLFTGSYPVRAESLGDLRRAHERGDRVPLSQARPDLPAPVLQVIERAMQPDPQLRYESCENLATALKGVTPGARTWRWTAIAALGLAASVVAGIWSWREVSMPAPPPANVEPVVTVLPFRNLSTEPDSDLIVDGLTYELIRNLAIIKGLQVTSATSSFAFKGKDSDLPEVGRRLGATLVLEGSVFGSGGQWRVNAQLAEVNGDRAIWSDKFDGATGGVFSIQEDIALEVVNQLRLALGTGQRRYDLDQEASTLYLKARTLVERRGALNAQAAIPLLRQVIARDPQFAPAYAVLADAYSFFSQDLPDVGGLDPERAVAFMRPAVEQALYLDPLLAEAHAALGLLHAREHAWEEAHSAFQYAIELNPSLTHAYTNYSLTTLMPTGRFADAEKLLGAALQRDPLSASLWREIAIIQVNSGRYDEALANIAAARALDPDLAFLPWLTARAQTLGGRVADAMPYWESVSGETGNQHWIAHAYVQTGRRAEIERLVTEHQHPFRLAVMYTALGDYDRAFDALARAADEAPHRTVRLLVYPELEPLRGDPRFNAIRAKFKLP